MSKIVVLVVAVLIVGVGGGLLFQSDAQGEPAAAKNGTLKIECQFWYRKSVSHQHTEEASFVVTVPVTNGDVLDIPLDLPAENRKLGDFSIHVMPQQNSLLVDVYDNKANRQILRQLFQTGVKLENQFSGSHGFTGLNYVYHPTSESELQFTCAVK